MMNHYLIRFVFIFFDADIEYPAPVVKDEDGNIAYTYREDYPQAGREFWVLLSYEF